MKMKKFFFILFFWNIYLVADIIPNPCLSNPTTLTCSFIPPISIPETTVPVLEFLAKTVIVPPGRYQILYRADLGMQPVPIQCFIRAHEYAHAYLNQPMKLIQNPQLNKEYELEADRQAAYWLIEQNQKCIVIFMANTYFSQAAFMQQLPPWYPTFWDLHQNLHGVLFNAIDKINEQRQKENSNFTIEIKLIAPGEFGSTVEIEIDDEEIGTISNFDDNLETEIEVSNVTEGIHQYKIRAKIYSFDFMLNPHYMRTIYSSGTINVKDGDAFNVVGDLSSAKLRKAF